MTGTTTETSNDDTTLLSSSSGPQESDMSMAVETAATTQFETTTPSPLVNNDESSSSTSTTSSTTTKMQRVWRKLIYVPYFIGIVWTGLHPRMSVLTGENKCRGWYIDESALDTQFATVTTYRGPPKPKPNQQQPKSEPPQRISGLCDYFNNNIDSTNTNNDGWTVNDDSNIICHRQQHHRNHDNHHHRTFDVAAIVPISGAVQPLEEAIVLVVPGANDWNKSEFHMTLLDWFPRLANPIEIPWLAKTVYLVSPITNTDEESEEDRFSSLEDTVSRFLDAYLGRRGHAVDNDDDWRSWTALPPRFSGAMLRNLIVLDVQYASSSPTLKGSDGMNYKQTSYTELSILPQGRRGVLPNMDLVFLVGQLFQRALFLNTRLYPNNSFLVHPYRKVYQNVQNYLETAPPNDSIPRTSFEMQAKFWADDMTNLGLFAYSMAMGPFPPHSPALDRGIDSLTLQIRFHGSSWTSNVMNDFFQVLEYLVRALSNLHERLHHSITLYLLPSPKKFVSHVEYLIPNLLILLPLAIRAVGLLVWDIDRFHLSSASWTTLSAIVFAVLGGVSGALLSSTTTTTTTNDDRGLAVTNAWFMAPYMILAFVWVMIIQGYRAQQEHHTRILNSMHFLVCLTAIYIHVPIVFANVSLGFPSALLWTPLLAFPKYGGSCSMKDNRISKWATWLGAAVVFMTAPPVLLVPRLFSSYTTYIRIAYIPLHVQLVMLVLCRLFY